MSRVISLNRRMIGRRALALVAALAVPASALAGVGASKGSYPGGTYPAYSYYGRSTDDLVVRPDVILISFELKKVTDDTESGLGAIQALVEELRRRYRSVSEDAAVETRNLSVYPAGEKQRPELQAVAVSGSIELPLAADWDYWKRAHLLVTLMQVARQVASTQSDAKKAILATIGAPTALLKNPEAFRAELTRRWLERARTFAASAQSAAAPLELLQCEPPDKVTQHHISLEEVGLSLRFNCRLDTATRSR